MKFYSPEYFYLLLLIPIFIGLRLYTYYKRRKALHDLGDKELVYQMMPQLSLLRENVKYTVILFIYSLLVFLLARPQMGVKVSKEERNGIEVMIAMDISNSMMAEDVVPSRLDKTKLLIENLVSHFTKDRVGLVVFAGEAFVQLPITNDYVSAKMFMNSISPQLIASQGTCIADALDLCMKSFTNQENIGKAIILITDGEDHEGGAEEMAEEAFKKGYNVFVLGVGSEKGAPVPDVESGGYMRDNTGEQVLSRLNVDMCKAIAEAGHGAFIHVENNNRAQELLNDQLSQLQKGQMDAVVYSDYEEQFQVVAWLILVLIVLELFISESSNGFFTRLSRMASKKSFLSTTSKTLTLIVLCLCALTANAQNDRQYVRSGNKHYRAQKFDKADIEYKKALERNPNSPEALYNMGCAKMMQEKDSLALGYFQKAAEMQKDKKRKAQIFHNAGVIMQNHQDYEKAINMYKESLRNNPTNDYTRYNLALCQALLKKQQKNQDQNKDNKDQNKEQNKKDKQNQKDRQNQNNNQNKDQNKNQNKDDQNNQNSEQDKKDKMNKENAEQLLNAAKNQERQTQEKVKAAQRRRQNSSRQKNW